MFYRKRDAVHSLCRPARESRRFSKGLLRPWRSCHSLAVKVWLQLLSSTLMIGVKETYPPADSRNWGMGSDTKHFIKVQNVTEDGSCTLCRQWVYAWFELYKCFRSGFPARSEAMTNACRLLHTVIDNPLSAFFAVLNFCNQHRCYFIAGNIESHDGFYPRHIAKHDHGAVWYTHWNSKAWADHKLELEDQQAILQCCEYLLCTAYSHSARLEILRSHLRIRYSWIFRNAGFLVQHHRGSQKVPTSRCLHQLRILPKVRLVFLLYLSQHKRSASFSVISYIIFICTGLLIAFSSCLGPWPIVMLLLCAELWCCLALSLLCLILVQQTVWNRF